MKKILLLLVSLFMLILCACGQMGGNVIVTTQAAEAGDTAAPTQTVIQATASPSQEISPAASESPAVSESDAASDNPKLYTSYAHMTAFNPSDSTASFDYFDLLRGDDAVQWLVDQEGYSKADAQAMVADFAESEYIEKNTNPQLRTVDLSAVPVTLIVSYDGSLNKGFEPRIVSIETIKQMYAADPDLLLKPFFYEVKVDDGGQVEAVNQIYWP